MGTVSDSAPTVRFLSPEEEAELIQRAEAGDPFAVNELLDAHEPIIQAAVNRAVSSDPQSGEFQWKPQLEDVARQALYDALLSFDPDRGRFGAYARTAVRNRVYNAVRQLREQEESDAVWLDDELGEEAGPGEREEDTFYDVTADPATDPHSAGPRAPDAFLNGPEASEEARHRKAQGNAVVGILRRNPTLLSRRQIQVVVAALKGWTIPRMADALDARPDSIERSLEKAAEKISEHLRDAGRFVDPFADTAEEERDGRYVDPFQQVQGGTR